MYTIKMCNFYYEYTGLLNGNIIMSVHVNTLDLFMIVTALKCGQS